MHETSIVAVLDYLEQTGIKARISFTGHSLGGALAQYMAIIVKGSSAETFGAPGILGALEDLADFYEPGYSYPVLNHVAYGDVIGLYGRHLGKVEHHIFDATDLMLPVLPLYSAHNSFYHSRGAATMPTPSTDISRGSDAIMGRSACPPGFKPTATARPIIR